jgi:hypothetical protein
VYDKGPLGENVFHLAMLLNTPSTLVIARYLVKLYRAPLVNCPFQVGDSQEHLTDSSSSSSSGSSGSIWSAVQAGVAGGVLKRRSQQQLQQQ